jgi:hypothetical protein
MQTLLITPKDAEQLELLTNLLKAMRIKTTVLTAEQKEDIGLSLLLAQADKSKTVSEQKILAKLKP